MSIDVHKFEDGARQGAYTIFEATAVRIRAIVLGHEARVQVDSALAQQRLQFEDYVSCMCRLMRNCEGCMSL